MPDPDATGEVLRTWDSVARGWEEYRDRVFSGFRPVSEWLVEHADPQPGQTVLELAAGPGETGFLAAARVGPEGRLISTDLAPRMVEAAQRGVDAAGLANVECRVMDAQSLELPLRIRLLEEVDFFLGKIQRGLDQHAQVDQRVAQRVDLARELAGQGPAGAARRGLGARIDQVGDGFGLRQVDLVVEEGALGELARLGHAQARRGARFQAARQQQLQHHRPAVGLQFEHVLAGKRVRPREVDRQPLVDGAAVGGEEGQVGRFAGFQITGADPGDDVAHCGARHAHDAHRAAPGRGGDGGNGLVVAGEHGGIVKHKGQGPQMRPLFSPSRSVS